MKFAVLQFQVQKPKVAVAANMAHFKKTVFLFIITILSVFANTGCTNNSMGDNISSNANDNDKKSLVYLTTVQFKEKVFDFEKNKEWAFAGLKPCLVDFYADWCGPCKKLNPILKELSEEYKDNIDIYKVNIDKEPALAQLFGISSIPALLFCPMNGKPSMSNGYIGKENLNKMIQDILLADDLQKKN